VFASPACLQARCSSSVAISSTKSIASGLAASISRLRVQSLGLKSMHQRPNGSGDAAGVASMNNPTSKYRMLIWCRAQQSAA